MDKKIREDRERISNIPETLVTENDKTPRIAIETSLMLPYRGQQGEKLLKSLSKTLNHFKNKHVTKVIYTGTKLGTNFSIKDTTLNFVYEVKCPEPTCNSSYIGEVSRRLGERIKDHCRRDSKISCLNTHDGVRSQGNLYDFTIISKSRRKSHYYFRKIPKQL